MSTAAHSPFGVSRLPGFWPSSRLHSSTVTETRCVHQVRMRPSSRSVPSSATGRPQTFSVSRRIRPRSSSWASFIPLPRPGFHSRSGASPSAQQPRLVGRTLPPCRWSSERSPAEASCHIRSPRLRGFSPCKDACPPFGVTRPLGRSPLQVHAPPGLHPPPMSPAYPGTNAHGVHDLDSEELRPLTFSVLSSKDQDVLSPEPPACSSFQASPRPAPKNQLALGYLCVSDQKQRFQPSNARWCLRLFAARCKSLEAIFAIFFPACELLVNCPVNHLCDGCDLLWVRANTAQTTPETPHKTRSPSPRPAPSAEPRPAQGRLQSGADQGRVFATQLAIQEFPGRRLDPR